MALTLTELRSRSIEISNEMDGITSDEDFANQLRAIADGEVSITLVTRMALDVHAESDIRAALGAYSDRLKAANSIRMATLETKLSTAQRA